MNRELVAESLKIIRLHMDFIEKELSPTMGDYVITKSPFGTCSDEDRLYLTVQSGWATKYHTWLVRFDTREEANQFAKINTETGRAFYLPVN